MNVYIEERVWDHPRTTRLCSFFPKANIIPIKHYKNIFDTYQPNPGHPTWIIAYADGEIIQEAPTGYGHSSQGFFFKTSLNCLYDCAYCYLKGAFRNDFPVHFVNYDDIQDVISKKNAVLTEHGSQTPIWWYASDWSDTIGFDQFLGWTESFFPFFQTQETMMVELRTKAPSIQHLLTVSSIPCNVEIAYSLNPQVLIDRYEKGTASLHQRISNCKQLMNAGYKVGLRLMPLLPVPGYEEIYKEFMAYVAQEFSGYELFSVFFGGLLYTHEDYKRMLRKVGDVDVLHRLSRDADGMWREDRVVRERLADLVQHYFPYCQICMDEID
ncbi:MAG: hypothetical protein NZL83_02510 [Candidatus Absconditabacterales bacterium]|nr:hypothetical protein [Candidatus Absconditabacterales bacterium]